MTFETLTLFLLYAKVFLLFFVEIMSFFKKKNIPEKVRRLLKDFLYFIFVFANAIMGQRLPAKKKNEEKKLQLFVVDYKNVAKAKKCNFSL